MKSIVWKIFLTGMFLSPVMLKLIAQNKGALNSVLSAKYNLIPEHSTDTQYYEMQSTLQKHAGDGTIQGTDIYRLSLLCIPANKTSQKNRYVCRKFTVQSNDGPILSIPSLVNWTWYFAIAADNRDSSGQIFGIDRSRFEHLKDENGKELPIENAYHIYNAFIDFHTMDVFAEKTKGDSGIQDLKNVGDRIVHQASYSKPTVALGDQVAEGSYFKNGEITLLFKGLGTINKKNCAIIEYDSGKSSFYMMIKPTPTIEIPTIGSSHYWGDIYKDLNSGWIQKAVLHELVISETSLSLTNKIHSVIERTIDIQNVRKGTL